MTPDWEVRIGMYRNGRRVELFVSSENLSPVDALYNANTDALEWAQVHPDAEDRR